VYFLEQLTQGQLLHGAETVLKTHLPFSCVSHYISQHTEAQPLILATVTVLLTPTEWRRSAGQHPYSGSASQSTKRVLLTAGALHFSCHPIESVLERDFRSPPPSTVFPGLLTNLLKNYENQ